MDTMNRPSDQNLQFLSSTTSPSGTSGNRSRSRFLCRCRNRANSQGVAAPPTAQKAMTALGDRSSKLIRSWETATGS
jgi:hypothetical protein